MWSDAAARVSQSVSQCTLLWCQIHRCSLVSHFDNMSIFRCKQNLVNNANTKYHVTFGMPTDEDRAVIKGHMHGKFG